jgi:serine/threonine protein kinase
VTLRVAKKSARSELPGATKLSAKIGAHFGRPAVLAISVITLVSAGGLLSTLSSYAALCRLGRKEASAELREQSARLEAAIGTALSTSDALLDRLVPHVRRTAPAKRTTLLSVLHELATARTGLTWISVGFADGAFVGVYRDEKGELLGQLSTVGASSGIQHKYRFLDSGVPNEISERPSSYDPRSREFYRFALAQRHRAWTPPYPFLPSLRTGISRVEPVFGAEGALVGVATVDFDASSLTPLLAESTHPGQKRAVLTGDDAVLATTGFVLPKQSEWSRDHPLRVTDVMDPLLTAMARASEHILEQGARSLSVDAESYYVDALKIGKLDRLPVVLVSAELERTLYAHASEEARRGVLITALVSLLSVLLAFVVSANIARLKQARASAEQAVREAEAELDELGSYELIELLGGGAMGEVYRARHKLLFREAALKLIRGGEDERESELEELFFVEARRLASMRSIHTVSVYDFGVASDGRYFLAMELLHGLDLDRLVRRYGPQPPARVALILAQICDSLAEAHEQGLVHQDIKPANVFLCRLAEALDVVKVLDFGISRAVGPRGARLSRTEGTPGFMSPEQILGDPVGPLADLYGVGSVGFFLLSGTPPFRGAEGELVQLEQIERPVPSLPEPALKTTPIELVQVITRCLAKRPENRPVSARVLADALREIARVHAHTFSPDEQARFWERFEEAPEKPEREALAPSHVRTLPARMYSPSEKRHSQA